MTGQELIDAGFRTFKPNKQMGDGWKIGYQLKVKDEYGIRYFIDVHLWDHSAYAPELPEGFEAFVHYVDGCSFHPSAAISIQAYSGVQGWSVQELIGWADQLWQRLSPNYYERWE